MTRALRRRHRVAVAILAVALPVAVAIALVVRPVLPPLSSRVAVVDATATAASTADVGHVEAAERLRDAAAEVR